MSAATAPLLIRAALRAYPGRMRRTEGDLLLSLAADLVESGRSSTTREALGLLRGGLEARIGATAAVPWAEALGRVALPAAVALLALVIGAASVRIQSFAWPGWSWIAVLTAPALATVGLLRGRAGVIAAGAFALLALAVAQGNSRLDGVNLAGDISWGATDSGSVITTGGVYLPLLGCTVPVALLLLGVAFTPPPRAPRATVVTALAWTAGGALAVHLILGRELRLGTVHMDGLAVCMVAGCLGAAAAAGIGTLRRNHDAAGALAGALSIACAIPPIALYVVSLLFDSGPGLAAAVLTTVLAPVLVLAGTARALSAEIA